MKTTKGLINEYLENLSELQKFEKKHENFFKEYFKLTDEKETLQGKITEQVKENKQGIENEMIKVSYIPVFRKNYDYKKFVENSSKVEYNLLVNSNGLEIKKDVLEKLKENGKISIDTFQSCFQETLSSERVDIKIKE